MTQAQAQSPSSGLHGQALLDELRLGHAKLPRKTLMALVMGGLRVRMMRSVVTMLSVVLAIAFLTYTGLANALTKRLAAAVQRYADQTPPDLARVEAAAAAALATDPLAALDADERRELADELGLDDARAAEAELLGITGRLSKAELEAQEAAQNLAALRANPESAADEVEAAAAKAEATRQAFEELRTREAALRSHAELAEYVESGKTGGAADLPARLSAALAERYRRVIGTMPTPGRLGEAELEQAEELLPLTTKAAPDAAATLAAALQAERDKRADAELRLLLRSTGVNLERVQAGDPLATWLIIMAFLTCAVGIANAMLMSVTERIREIGTMKCLGAVDGLVVKLFLLESAFLGVIGAVLGIVLGFIVALLAAWLQYGRYGLVHFPWGLDGLTVLGGSVVGGLILAVVGAAYPAWTASRMRPVDALRVDE